MVTKKFSIALVFFIELSLILLATGTSLNTRARWASRSSSLAASQPVETTSTQGSVVPDDTVNLFTTMGNITIELFGDMPITSGNFKNLTEHGIYDGTLFSRVAHNFVIQGGDASPKGIVVPTIFDELPNKHSNVKGSVAMANTGAPNSATSQFYINLIDNTFLDKGYVVFGKVIKGMNVVEAIGNVATSPANDGHPLKAITIIKAEMSGPVPEFSQSILFILFMTATLLVVMVKRTKRSALSDN